MRRKIITIDERLCNGCGQCIPGCPEGALQLIEGKARLVSDLYCDGLGACIGDCPLGAIRVEEREAGEYEERRVMQNVIRQGEATIRAHLAHLRDHGQEDYLREAMAVLEEHGLAPDAAPGPAPGTCPVSACPAAAPAAPAQAAGGLPPRTGGLRHFPVQLHLIPPSAPYFRDADVLLAADCVPCACPDFHRDLLRERCLAVACPKLDANQDIYLDKLTALIDHAGIRSLTVAVMEVPCCRGLLALARAAAAQARRRLPLSWVEVSVQGQVLRREQVLHPEPAQRPEPAPL